MSRGAVFGWAFTFRWDLYSGFHAIVQNLRSGQALIKCCFLEQLETRLVSRYKHDMTLSTKFSDVTLPSLHFRARSVFCRLAFYRPPSEIVNIEDIDQKFLGSISDVNVDNPRKCCEIIMSRSCISRKQVN